MIRAWSVTAVAAAVVAATAVTGCAEPATETGPRETAQAGPLRAANPHAWAATKPVGARFADGMEVLRFAPGVEQVTLTGVTLVGGDGLEVLGVKVAGPGREIGAIQIVHSWPPVDRELPAASVTGAFTTTLDPTGPGDRSWELLLGLRATRPGYLVRDGIRVDYVADGQEYSRVIPAVLAICAEPRGARTGTQRGAACPIPKDWLRRAETAAESR